MAALGVSELRRPAATAGCVLVAALLALGGCGGTDGPPAQPDPVVVAQAAGWDVDTVGVVNLAEGDTINLDEGLTIIETTRIFPPEADEGAAFAWEFQAQSLNPVKLLIVRAVDGARSFEILGESPMVVPRQLGANRFELPEPIPLKYPCMFGIYMPEAGTVPFRKVTNWKSLIAMRPLERPFIDRTPFSMYGWRYGVRVFWRRPGQDPQATIHESTEPQEPEREGGAP